MSDISIRIKVAGVQYAVNTGHVRNTPMSQEERQRTIDFLSRLDVKRPLVSVTPEPSNQFDDDAFVVRWLSHKCGYVRNKQEYKAAAHEALTAGGGRFFRARIVEVEVADSGYFMIEVVLPQQPALLPAVDRWADWDMNVPALPSREDELMLADALLMLQDLTALDAEEVSAYCDVVVRHGRHALWREAIQQMEDLVKRLEAMPGMHGVADGIDHLLSGMCNEHREAERRDEWWPGVLASTEAADMLRQWRHEQGLDVQEPDRLELTQQLLAIERGLTDIPTIAHPDIDDEVLLMTRAHYAQVPGQKWHKLLSAMIIRRQIRHWLGMPEYGQSGVKEVIEQEERRYIEQMVRYATALPKLEQVEVLQTFIYRQTPALPPDLKHRVDAMTVRFRDQSSLVSEQTSALHEQTDALRAVAGRKTIGTLILDQHNQGVNPNQLDSNNTDKLLDE